MKKILSLSLLGALPLIPAVSCTPLTISNENPQISNWNEALNTIATSSELCLELMEHPMKRQDNIKELLKDINKTCKKCI